MSTKSDAHDGNYSVGSVIEQAKCFLNVPDASYSFLLATITDWRSPARSVIFLTILDSIGCFSLGARFT